MPEDGNDLTTRRKVKYYETLNVILRQALEEQDQEPERVPTGRDLEQRVVR